MYSQQNLKLLCNFAMKGQWTMRERRTNLHTAFKEDFKHLTELLNKKLFNYK